VPTRTRLLLGSQHENQLLPPTDDDLLVDNTTSAMQIDPLIMMPSQKFIG